MNNHWLHPKEIEMRTLPAVLLTFLLSTQLFGQTVLLEGLKPGTYVIKVSPTGEVKVIKNVKVITLSKEPTTPPIETLGLIKFTKDNKPKDQATAAKIGALYSLMAEEVKKGSFKTPQAAANAVRAGFDLLTTDPKWKSFRTKLATQLKANDIQTLAQVEQAFREIALGLTENKAINPTTLALIIKIIQIILQLFGNK